MTTITTPAEVNVKTSVTTRVPLTADGPVSSWSSDVWWATVDGTDLVVNFAGVGDATCHLVATLPDGGTATAGITFHATQVVVSPNPVVGKYGETTTVELTADVPVSKWEVRWETPGVSISGNVLTWTPTAAGDSNVNLMLTVGTDGVAVSLFLTAEGIAVAPLADTTLTVGSPMTPVTLGAFPDGLQLVAVGLPEGVECDQAGNITGTPIRLGVYAPIVYAITPTGESAGASVPASWTVVVPPSAPVEQLPDPLAPLATVADLADATGRVIPEGSDAYRAALLYLRRASAVVRAYCRSELTRRVETVILDPLDGAPLAYLPHGPVIEVNRVELLADDATWVDATGDVQWSATTRLVEPRPGVYGVTWPPYVRSWRITYTWGFNPVPDDLVAVTAALAGEAFASTAGVDSKTIGGFTVKYTKLRELSELDRMALAPYVEPVIA